jgi:hypothetical protein
MGAACSILRCASILRNCQPREELGNWFRSHGSVLSLYLALGALAYSYLEVRRAPNDALRRPVATQCRAMGWAR